jgi:glycosyltransferase involved in cell wall biosynthesis
VHIVYFFTYGYSLKSWHDSGILDREIRIFDNLIKKYNFKFTFVTYGDSSDHEYKLNKNIKVLPIYTFINKSENNLLNIVKTFYLSKKIKSETNNFDLIKQNQLLGSWVSIALKFSSNKPLYIRTGYDMFLFSIKDRKSPIKIISYYILTAIALMFSNIYSVSSESDRKFLNKWFIFNKNKIVKRSNWVENNKLKPFDERKSHRLLSVGRLEKQKNYKHLITSLKGTNLSLDIIGVGDEKTQLEELAVKLNVDVNFLGIVSNNDLLKLYSNYKYFVSSSLFEGNPKATLEAMSSGCIVVTRDIANNREIIDNFQNGILFDKSNYSLSEALLNLEDTKNLNNISKNAITSTLKFNSLEKLTTEIAKDIQSFMQS